MKTHYNTLKHFGILLLLLVGTQLTAQTKETFTIPLSNPGQEGKLVVNIIDGNITVQSHNGEDVIVEATGQQQGNKGWNNKKQQRSKNGMKRIVDNSLSFTVEEINNKVYIKYTPGKWVIDFVVKVPKQFSLDLKTVNKGNIVVEGVDGTHEASNTNGKITMRNVGGSVIADALNQDIVVTFASVHNNANMMFSSLNGDVDISFPKSLKANVLASSNNGNVYTDFEIVKVNNGGNVKTTNKNGVYKVTREKGVAGTINGGGADIVFKTLNGDILIRENK
ncbi:hypothetical protein POV27_09805 [Aureisphaera galaxeae]|uniref:DUF4097 family beta strand repeat-containing protein n=1 Tax=Aureisphaera galaxeae TaxID=1538023 RepID=UPI002350688B|nr:DUF4097 family beta strand repeat-containing protein [Aureisphaera galaxeae]MDC8004346.1 hypothetical protein [Aureisphaera galaxeae]